MNIVCFLQILILMNIASNDEYRLFPSGICAVVYSGLACTLVVDAR